jgi:Protein of unknown function (DUF4232)
MRMRTIVVAGSALALLTALTACSSSTPAAGQSATTAAHGAPGASGAAPATTGGAAAGGGGGAGGGAAAPGHGGEGDPSGASVIAASFRAELTIQKAGLGLLTLTNVSKNDVTLKGWPTLEFLNAANEPVAVPTQKVNVPGAGPSITVAPGRTAFAGVKWAVGDKGATSTFVATSVQLTPPAGTGRINVSIVGTNGHSGGDVELDMTSAQVGTLQPSSQGVLVF